MDNTAVEEKIAKRRELIEAQLQIVLKVPLVLEIVCRILGKHSAASPEGIYSAAAIQSLLPTQDILLSEDWKLVLEPQNDLQKRIQAVAFLRAIQPQEITKTQPHQHIYSLCGALILVVIGPHDCSRGVAVMKLVQFALLMTSQPFERSERSSATMKFEELEESNANSVGDSIFSAIFDVQMWITQFVQADLTAKTLSFALTDIEVQMLFKVVKNVSNLVFKEKCKLESTSGGSQKHLIPPDSSIIHWCQMKEARKGIEDWSIIEGIVDKISETMSKLRSSNGFFVKLSSRSPKDSLLLKSRTKELTSILSTDDLQAIGIKDALESVSSRVICPWEALDILCSSARVEEDIELWVPGGSIEVPSDNLPPLEIVIRQWVPIHHWSELRSWVSNYQLNAISQYFVGSFSADPSKLLQRHQKSIEAMIIRYFSEKVCPILKQVGLPNCVVDFGLSPISFSNSPSNSTTHCVDGQCHCRNRETILIAMKNCLDSIIQSERNHHFCTNGNNEKNICKLQDFIPVVVELNPFCHRAGTSLFNWEDDNDYNTMLKGPLKFKVQQ